MRPISIVLHKVILKINVLVDTFKSAVDLKNGNWFNFYKIYHFMRMMLATIVPIINQFINLFLK